MNTFARQKRGTRFGVQQQQQVMKKENPAYDSDEDEGHDGSSSSFFGFRMPSHFNNERPKAPVRQPSMEMPSKKTTPAKSTCNRSPPSREPSLEGVGALQQMWQKYDSIVESMSSWGSNSSSASSVTTADSWDDSGATNTFQSSRESWEDSSYIAPLPGDSFSSSQAPPGVRGVRRAASCSLTPVRETLKINSIVLQPRAAPSQRSIKRGASTGSVPSLLGSNLGPFKNPFNRTVTPLSNNNNNSFTRQGPPAWQGSLTHQGSFVSQGSLTRQNSFASSTGSLGLSSRQNSFNSQASLAPQGTIRTGNLTRQGSLKRNGSFNKRGFLKKQASIPRQNSFNLQQNSLNMQRFFSDYDKITTPDAASTTERGPRPSVTGW